jgi:hypothetical protein
MLPDRRGKDVGVVYPPAFGVTPPPVLPRAG